MLDGIWDQADRAVILQWNLKVNWAFGEKSPLTFQYLAAVHLLAIDRSSPFLSLFLLLYFVLSAGWKCIVYHIVFGWGQRLRLSRLHKNDRVCQHWLAFSVLTLSPTRGSTPSWTGLNCFAGLIALSNRPSPSLNSFFSDAASNFPIVCPFFIASNSYYSNGRGQGPTGIGPTLYHSQQ